jgi:hypothetical protein
MVSVVVLSLLTGCAGQPVDKNAKEAVNEKQAAEAVTEKQTADDAQPEPTSAPTPEPEPFAPADIFGSEFNPFYDVKFPQNFDIYNANFDIGNPKFKGMPKYVLSMTAEGDTAGTIKFLSKLAVSMFEQALKDRFDISLKELYALPIR